METERTVQIGRTVRAFYETYSFPGYEECETSADLVQKAKRSQYAELLDTQLPLGVTILEVGCGTGQLSAFLSMTHRTVVGVDFSFHSLQQGAQFTRACRLQHVHFAQMDLFQMGFQDNTFDYVICNGVLHHTADAYRGFQALCRVLKPHGYLLLGLYNTYGRTLTRCRQRLFRWTKGYGQRLDGILRQRRFDTQRREAWFMDQYCHPHEQTFSVHEVLAWFARNGIEYINSIPKIRLSDALTAQEQLWEPRDAGGRFEQLLAQVGWVLTTRDEGGLFVTIGRKRTHG